MFVIKERCTACALAVQPLAVTITLLQCRQRSARALSPRTRPLLDPQSCIEAACFLQANGLQPVAALHSTSSERRPPSRDEQGRTLCPH